MRVAALSENAASFGDETLGPIFATLYDELHATLASLGVKPAGPAIALYADSGDDGVLKVFSLIDFHILKTIKISDDADGVLYDPASKTVLVVAGDSKNLTVVSVTDDKVVKTIALPGKPEFFAVDGHNHAFVNIADTGSLRGHICGPSPAPW